MLEVLDNARFVTPLFSVIFQVISESVGISALTAASNVTLTGLSPTVTIVPFTASPSPEAVIAEIVGFCTGDIVPASTTTLTFAVTSADTLCVSSAVMFAAGIVTVNSFVPAFTSLVAVNVTVTLLPSVVAAPVKPVTGGIDSTLIPSAFISVTPSTVNA